MQRASRQRFACCGLSCGVRVLITGCSTGIGRACAQELADRGHFVVATARDPKALNDVRADLRLPLDVTDTASVAAAVEAAGPLDALVNNAGISISGPVELVPPQEYQQLFDTNVFGGVRVMQAVVPLMRAQGSGVIVNVSSSGGRAAFPLHGPYSASKAALEALSEAMYYELAPFGIRVVILEPGFVATQISANARRYGENSPDYAALRKRLAENAARQVGGSLPGPKAVATAVADAIEATSTPLRIPVGDDARTLLNARTELDDAGFEQWLRELLGLNPDG
jgi:NAD(P)-dependent dehydrogenase (short-subunit alcohol dehydrogenase family)